MEIGDGDNALCDSLGQPWYSIIIESCLGRLRMTRHMGKRASERWKVLKKERS
jgi:hypothetical protein